MSEQKQTDRPNFDSIRQETEQGIEYWSARDLSKLLGYDRWENFDVAVKRAKTACTQIGQNVQDHLRDATKMMPLGKGGSRAGKDYWLSRFGAYLAAQNGDPRKPEIAAAQAYFASTTREHELYQLQEKRVELRQRLDAGNEALEQAAKSAGVLPRSFGLFHRAGYEGLYGGLGPDEIKKLKGITEKENLLDRMSYLELAANDFRVAYTADKLERDNVLGQTAATEIHREVGKEVRETIKRLGGSMPEDLPAEPSIKPLLKGRRKKADLPPPATDQTQE